MNLERLFSAFEFTKKAHEGQRRKTGEPYITHPVQVAQIAGNYKADEETIIACLLHDIVEDCGVRLSEVKRRFGESVAFLMDGVTKMRSPEETYKKIEDYSRKDKRVTLIKFCDRIHNTSTLFNELRSLDKTWDKYRISNYNYIRLGKKLGYSAAARELESKIKSLEKLK